MEHFEAVLSREQSDAFVDEIEAGFDASGWGLWAVELRSSAAFLGFVGLKAWDASSGLPFAPAVEVGWRLSREAWGFGYATEAARAALAYGFATLDLEEIVSMTAVTNERSWRVMERLGMTHDPADDFDHPKVSPGHRLERHVLYRLRAEGWRG